MTVIVTVPAFRLVIPGPPTGKARPRVTRNGTFTPEKTRRAEADIRAIWREAGEPRLPDGPVAATIAVFEQRPVSHFTTRGELSAVGRRTPYPLRRPDADNIQKGLFDSLNGLAYRDDVQIVDIAYRRRWSTAAAHIVLTLLMKIPQDQTSDVDALGGVTLQTPLSALGGNYPVMRDSNAGVSEC